MNFGIFFSDVKKWKFFASSLSIEIVESFTFQTLESDKDLAKLENKKQKVKCLKCSNSFLSNNSLTIVQSFLFSKLKSGEKIRNRIFDSA